MANISAIKLPNGNTYTIKDSVSGYTTNTGTITKISTTAGSHSTIDVSSGVVSFNVPTKTSHLTNDSGYITASHTSTYSLPLAASDTRGGVQIGYSESGTNYAVKLSSEKMYVSVPWTDTKVTTAALTSGTTYYPILATETGTATRQIDSILGGLKYVSTAGTTSAVGTATLYLGNTTGSGTANNEQGILRLYSSNATYYTDLKSSSASSNKTITFPNATGTVALTSDIPTASGALSKSTNDIQLNFNDGTQNRKVLDIVKTTIDNISGVRIDYDTGDTDPSSIFLPDGVGFNTGSQAILNQIPIITLNGSSTTSPSFYAPTSAGTSGYVLTSNGSGAPSWTSVALTDEKLKVANDAVDNTIYYPIFGSSSTSAETKKIDSSGFKFRAYNGTANVTGSSEIILGNDIASGTAGNKIGYVKLYGGTQYSYTITGGTLHPLANRTLTLPDKTGTIALTSDLPDVSGKIDTAGTGLSKSGTTLNHSNSVTAQTTQAVYPIKIDAQGHISAYGNAVTIPTIPSNNVTGSGSTDYLARWSGTNTLSSSHLSTSTSYNSSSDLYGKAKFYIGDTGQIDWQGQLVFYSGNLSKTITVTPPSLTTESRTLTLPDASGTIALTSDIPTVNNATLTIQKNGTTVNTFTANASSNVTANISVPTKVSDLTNDSGFITASHTSTYSLPLAASGTRGGVQIGYSESGTNYAVKLSSEKMYVSVPWTDTKVTNTTATAATTYYLTGSTSNATATGGLSKHASLAAYTTADTATSGYTQLRLGNTTVTSSAGGKEGQIRLYGTTATYYVDLKAGAPSANRTITLPNKTGTVALTSDIPTATSTPTASTIAKFDSSAKMNSIDMTSSEIDSFVDGLDISGINAVDYIVEQGTDGIWTYRKWTSGVAECWGRRGSTSYAMTVASGYAYYSYFSQALPSGLFTSVTSALSGRCGGTSSQALISTNIFAVDTANINCFIWQPASGTQNVDVAFNVKGRWK